MIVIEIVGNLDFMYQGYVMWECSQVLEFDCKMDVINKCFIEWMCKTDLFETWMYIG